jgi:dienelactone hydrolase
MRIVCWFVCVDYNKQWDLVIMRCLSYKSQSVFLSLALGLAFFGGSLMKRLILLMMGVWLLATACAPATEPPTATAVSAPAQEAEAAAIETAVPTAVKVPPTQTPVPSAEPQPTAAPVTESAAADAPIAGQILSEPVVIAAADGLELNATFYALEGLENAPGVILLHMLGSNRTIWETVGLVDELAANGYAVLALDMRGHGETGGSQDWVQVEDDIQRVWQYFVDRPEVDAEKTAVLGASIGSNMALIAAANEPAMRTAILLSPGLVFRGVAPAERLPDYGDRPLLIVASENDYYSEDSANKLAETAVGETSVKIYQTAGHGTEMFAPQPDLTPLILDWLAQHLVE